MIQSKAEVTIKNASPVTCLFLDIGGVLLSDGWDLEKADGSGGTIQ